MKRTLLRSWLVRSLLVLIAGASVASVASAQLRPDEVQDLTLLISPDRPCVWPVGMTQHVVVPSRTFGPGPYHRDLIVIDEHTGTQWDAPAHFVPPPNSGLPGAGPNGLITGEKVPAWQFCGEACVIDIRQHIDEAPDGESYLIRPETVYAWEKQNRPLKFGDVVLFRSEYSDKYYKPFPAGERFVTTALRKETPGWPAPTPETMAYLGEKGVMTLGLDGASMGPIPNLAVATHQAGGKLGMIWTECSTNLGSLPTTGAFTALLVAKHAGGSGGECRGIGITEPKLAARLNESARHKRVADLSVTLDEDFPVTWPGYGPGDEASRYVAKTLNAFSKARGPYFAKTHLLDGQAGTHVVLPSYSLPPEGFDNARYSADVQASLKKYEGKYGARAHSAMTAAQAPLHQMMGEAHVVDIRKLVGSTKAGDWPASPAITAELLKQHDASRPFKPGEVVIFYSGYSDQHFKPLPEAPELDGLFAAPLAGKAEGWPAPTAEAIAFLADKGIRCIGTDGPTLGGVDRENALMVYWLAASKGILPVEFLTNVGAIDGKAAYFLFAPIKIQGTRGGYGRALALY
ncbi:MAG: cyclase family protein [Planctomycetes bacterium]|nr:cyclase family protein [Planctomycetota bacterium]